MKSSKEIVIVKQELFIGLTEEQIAKVKACKNQEEILKVAKEEGVELSDEQLEAVSGGCGDSEPTQPTSCPSCGAGGIQIWRQMDPEKDFKKVKFYNCRCNRCGHTWTTGW